MYANPHDSQNDNQYALTDTAQHYETVSQICQLSHDLLSFSLLSAITIRQSAMGHICAYYGMLSHYFDSRFSILCHGLQLHAARAIPLPGSRRYILLCRTQTSNCQLSAPLHCTILLSFQVVKNGNGVPDQESSTFFTESDIYWVPASDTAGLYEQLSRNHFREIQRDCVE